MFQSKAKRRKVSQRMKHLVTICLLLCCAIHSSTRLFEKNARFLLFAWISKPSFIVLFPSQLKHKHLHTASSFYDSTSFQLRSWPVAECSQVTIVWTERESQVVVVIKMEKSHSRSTWKQEMKLNQHDRNLKLFF